MKKLDDVVAGSVWVGKCKRKKHCVILRTRLAHRKSLKSPFPTTGNSLPLMVPLYAVTYVGAYMMEDSCFSGPCTHVVYNSILVDTVTTCIDYVLTDSLTGEMDTLNCCFDQVWDGTTQSWLRISSPVGIEELQAEGLGDDKIYDLMGRELPEAPIGQIYIQNRKRYFRFE